MWRRAALHKIGGACKEHLGIVRPRGSANPSPSHIETARRTVKLHRDCIRLLLVVERLRVRRVDRGGRAATRRTGTALWRMDASRRRITGAECAWCDDLARCLPKEACLPHDTPAKAAQAERWQVYLKEREPLALNAEKKRKL